MEYQLRHLTDTLETFDEEQICIDYISTISLQSQSSSVYFILSDKFYEITFPIIQQQQQINSSIYMFAPSGTSFGYSFIERINKSYQLFFDHNCLISKLSKERDTEEKISMSIYIQDMKNVPIECLDKESQTFLLFQLLTSTLQEREGDETGIDDFHNILYQYNERDISYLEQLYSPEDIIQWYASNTFISRLLNESLRTKNISLIYELRVFIVLLLHIPFIHNSNIPLINNDKILTSFRKECITKEKLIKLKLNVNRLLSINEFYITTLEKPNYILHQSESTDIECVLFQIDIDTSTQMIHPYVIINNYGLKILFTFGTVFQIDSVELDTNIRIWNVKLIINEEVNNQVIDLINQLAEEFSYPFDFMAMGDLMDDISEYNKAIECYQIFLGETSEDHENIPMAYEHLGISYYHNGSYIEALKSYYKALSLYRLRSVSPHDHPFVDIYGHIALAYYDRRQYAIAIDYFKEAIRIQKLHSLPIDMAHFYSHIRDAYSGIGDKQKYHEYLGKTMVMKIENSPAMMLYEHPSYEKTINYTILFESFQEVLIHLLNNKSSTTQQFDYDIATIHYKIGEIYFEREKYEQALNQFKEVVEIYLNIFPLTLSNLIRNYDTIIDTSILIFKNYLFEYELYFRLIPLRYSLLAETYRYMAKIYLYELKNIQTTLNMYQLVTAIESIQQDY